MAAYTKAVRAGRAEETRFEARTCTEEVVVH